MTKEYNFHEIENKWQKKWEQDKTHQTNLSEIDKKHYCLTMFSYPSGDKLHIGHWYNYGPVDTYARFMKMKGCNVFQPQGFDAFGLPAENYAIKNGIHPAISTEQNIKKMKSQLCRIGAMYDWSNEINTSSPEYYKWTQWLFLQLYKNGLAYQKNAPVNWCPSCSTVLANEQVKDGHCDRCNTEVTKKDLTQWFFKITDYAEELLDKLDTLDWPKKTKHMQKNWIGKSSGANIEFEIDNHDDKITVFTTRPDTIFGATYMVLAPEHELVGKITTTDNIAIVSKYVERTKTQSEIDRTSTDREKTGVFTGAYAITPFTHSKIPIWIGDYVLSTYGSGAIMAVPSGDERDFEFAKKFKLPIIEVVSEDGEEHGTDYCYPDYGVSVNSDKFTGIKSEEVFSLICNELEERGIGQAKEQYRLHDWLISRQRYWGAPIPVIYCDDCGDVPVPENQLPVNLPQNIEFSSTYGKDISPLATVSEFVNTTCPTCDKPAKRDTDTMDTFVCSSWYYLRYPNAKIETTPFDKTKLDWLPVDTYVGGAEHATMHLLYARFITKALRDLGFVNFDEPFTKLYHQGTITKDGAKMSKSKGNTVSPDEFVEKYGSDTFRAYLMFMGPFDEGGDWNDKGITGIYRFLNKVWKFCHLPISNEKPSDKDLQIMHKTIQSVSNDLSQMKFNTALSRLMEFINYYNSHSNVSLELQLTFIKLLAPIAPHISEQMWKDSGKRNSVFVSQYPKYDPELAKENTINIVVQVNGKLRGNIEVDTAITKDELLSKVKEIENVKKYLNDKQIIKEIIVPQRLINFVVK